MYRPRRAGLSRRNNDILKKNNDILAARKGEGGEPFQIGIVGPGHFSSLYS
jgi:hypothetical protein